MTGARSTTLSRREAVVMAKDLPNRPKSEGSAPAKKVSATDRVKSKADKLDPRFEAARQRIVREDERRARAEAARQAKLAAQTETPAEPANGTREPAGDEAAGPKKGFSFSQTDHPSDEVNERNRKDAS
jgi:hypothetical protein